MWMVVLARMYGVSGWDEREGVGRWEVLGMVEEAWGMVGGGLGAEASTGGSDIRFVTEGCGAGAVTEP